MKAYVQASFSLVLADVGILLLMAFVVLLPFFLRWSGSALSYTPDPGDYRPARVSLSDGRSQAP